MKSTSTSPHALARIKEWRALNPDKCREYDKIHRERCKQRNAGLNAPGVDKWCSRCARVLSASEFSKASNRSDGLSCYCKQCTRDYSKERHDRMAQEARKCAGCLQVKSAGDFAYGKHRCKVCCSKSVRSDKTRQYFRNYSRHYRPSNESARRWRANNPRANKAHLAVFRAIRRGEMQRQPCEVCGTTEHIHAHHDDYSKPLDVEWLCAKHHSEKIFGPPPGD